MLGNQYTDLMKYEYLTRLSPRNAKRYVIYLYNSLFSLSLGKQDA